MVLDIVVAFEFVLEAVSAIDGIVEREAEEGSDGGDLHGSGTRVSLTANDETLAFEKPCWSIAGMSCVCPTV